MQYQMVEVLMKKYSTNLLRSAWDRLKNRKVCRERKGGLRPCQTKLDFTSILISMSHMSYL